LDRIDDAQQCAKQCSEAESLNLDSDGMMYGNVLFECLDQISSSNGTVQLADCCSVNAACEGAFNEAGTCLQSTLTDISEASIDYLTCIRDKKADQECPFAQVCAAILVGGYGTNYTNNFGVGDLGNLTESATTCEDLDIFGENACTEISNCCQPCADKIAAVVNAVVDELLLPSSSSTLAGCGGEKSCDYYMDSTERQLENTVESPSVGSTINDVANSIDIASLAGQCNDDLANEIVIYNTTSAVSNFFGCLHKNVGKIIAETDANELEAERTSGSAVSSATATALSAIVSTFISLAHA